MHKPPNIHIRNAYLDYAGNVIFDQLNITLPAGKITCLLGPSGVGKTTLLRMIANLIPLGKNNEEHFTGEISSDSSLPLREEIAYLAQQDSLLPWLTAIDNATLSARLSGNITSEHYQHAKKLFSALHLTQIENKFPHQLSGGMRQRVILIRTLLADKPIILMDEPFSAVDAITRFQLQSLAVEYFKNRTVLLITHDPIEALRMADEIYILSGQPARIQLAATLVTPKPRDFNDHEFIKYQSILFKLLTEAKEASL